MSASPIPLPLPPLNVNPSSSAQSGSRSDSYQGGVSLVQPFGEFNVVGGGTASSPVLTTGNSAARQALQTGQSSSGGVSTPVLVGGILLAGVALWFLLKKK